MAVRLYHFPPSLCSQKVRLALEEKGVDWTSQWVDIGLGMENYQPWYAKLNPRLVVPTLEHDGHVITDSARIVRYIDRHFDGPALTPSSPSERAAMDSWMDRIDRFPFRELSYGSLPSFMSKLRDRSFDRRRATIRAHMERAPELRDVYEAKLDDIEQWERSVQSSEEIQGLEDDVERLTADLEGSLRERPWVAGPGYSLADVLVTVALARLKMIGFRRLVTRHYASVARYYARARKRPSFERADLWERKRPGTLLHLFGRAMWLRWAG